MLRWSFLVLFICAVGIDAARPHRRQRRQAVQVEAAANREQREPLVQQEAVVKPNFVLFYDPM
jgi:hypothetical protein